MSNQFLILGPPGTGKTHKLIEIMEQELEMGILPNRIAFLSFTKKATENARDRMVEKFGFTKEDMPWCRTIHSLGFNRLGLSRDEVMQWKNYKEVGEALGLQFSKNVDPLNEEGIPASSFTGDRYMFIEGFARARCITPQDAYRVVAGEGDEDLSWFEFERFRNTLREYKTSRSLLDFSDMLEYQPSAMDIDVVIVDEAQDLSTLQWQYLNTVVTPNARRVYIAGDDDQAIFQWSGADVRGFCNLTGHQEVLHQSHRVPQAVYKVASQVAGGIKDRYPKEYLPKEAQGSVTWHFEPDAVDLSAEGNWLLLARNSYLLPQLVAMVRSQGFSYCLRGESAINQDHLQAIDLWEKKRKGMELSEEMENLVKAHLNPRNWGLDAPWFEALTKIPREDREWYRSLRRRGEKLHGTPRINISTIHGVKGGEAEHVMLLSDMSNKTFNSAQIDHDAESRVWYVGVTRAKENLHIIQPQGSKGWDL